MGNNVFYTILFSGNKKTFLLHFFPPLLSLLPPLSNLIPRLRKQTRIRTKKNYFLLVMFKDVKALPMTASVLSSSTSFLGTACPSHIIINFGLLM